MYIAIQDTFMMIENCIHIAHSYCCVLFYTTVYTTLFVYYCYQINFRFFGSFRLAVLLSKCLILMLNQLMI